MFVAMPAITALVAACPPPGTLACDAIAPADAATLQPSGVR
jgi:hypothetical protein